MRAQYGIVLYVIAKDAVDGQDPMLRGPQAGEGLTKRQIEEAVTQHFGPKRTLRRRDVDAACNYLLQARYCQLRGGKASKKYVLHETAAAPSLVLAPEDADFLLQLAELVDDDGRLSLKDVVGRGAKQGVFLDEIAFKNRLEASRRVDARVAGYLQSASSPDELVLDVRMVEEERPYLELVAGLRFRPPRGGRTAELGERPRPFFDIVTEKIAPSAFIASTGKLGSSLTGKVGVPVTPSKRSSAITVHTGKKPRAPGTSRRVERPE